MSIIPTYKNETDKRITFCDKCYLEWQPGDEKRLSFFVPHKRLGLTVIDPAPYVLRGNRDLGYHEMLIAPGASLEERTYNLPYFESFELSVFVLKNGGGDEEAINKDLVRMYVGDSEVPQIVDIRNNHLGHYAWDMSAYLVFESDHPSAVVIKVEPYTFRGTEKISGR